MFNVYNLCWTTNLFGFDIVYIETELFRIYVFCFLYWTLLIFIILIRFCSGYRQCQYPQIVVFPEPQLS